VLSTSSHFGSLVVTLNHIRGVPTPFYEKPNGCLQPFPRNENVSAECLLVHSPKDDGSQTMLNKIVQEDLQFIVDQNLPWNDLNNSTILVAGANSYLAAYMVETILYLNDICNKKIHVIALTRNKEKAWKRYEHHKNRNDLEFIYQDVCEPIQFNNDRKINYIIHAASPASPKYYDVDPVGTLSANTIGTMNLLDIAKKEDINCFLYLSTGGVYGRIEEINLPMGEDDYGYLDPTDVKSCYNESKRMGENICVSWSHQHGIPTKIVRISYVYGPGMDLNDKRVFHAFVSDIVKGRNILMKSDGHDTRAFCYIADAAAAFFTVLLKGGIGEAYNVGVENQTSIIGLANILIDLFPEKGTKIIKRGVGTSPDNIKGPIRKSCLDISKIKLLGWEPVFDIKEGSKRTIISYSGEAAGHV